MKFELNKIVRKSLVGIEPYSTARDEFKGAAPVYLDANENPFDGEHNRYPDPTQSRLKDELAHIKKVAPNQIILGNGSDELIDLLFRAFCEPGHDNVIIPQPTYGMYTVCAQINNIEIRQPLLSNEFQLEEDLILKNLDAHTKLIFLCSPNNPTGNLLSAKSIISLLRSFSGLVIVDEAYIDFAESEELIPRLSLYPNLVVLQTLSKAWGLAGLRIGIGYASTDIIAFLSKIKPPYNISSLSQSIALKALTNSKIKNEKVEITIEERGKLENNLSDFSFIKKIFPSRANFLLIEMDDAKKCYQYLLKNGIVVRDRSSAPKCDNCLRITIGTPDHNRILLEVLNTYQKEVINSK